MITGLGESQADPDISPHQQGAKGFMREFRLMGRSFGTWFLSLILVVACGCTSRSDSVNAAGNASDKAPVSSDDAAGIFSDYGGLYKDPKLTAWLTGIGRGLAAKSGRPEIKFSFAVLDSAAVNAFSTPDGAIFITRGLIALSNSDAEIAGVLGHEIGHVVMGDRAERNQAGEFQEDIIGLFAKLTAWTGAKLGPGSRDAQFSRDQELAADAFAIKVEASAGYDARGLPAVLVTLNRAARAFNGFAERLTLSGAYDDTHPMTSERVARASELANRIPGSRRVGRDTYLRAVDGMTYGNSAEQGYFRGDVFVHPRGGFLFKVPAGFSIRNAPSELVGYRADGTEFTLTSAIPGVAATPYDYLTERWTSGLSIKADAPVRINGHPAATASALVLSDRGQIDARFAVVGWSPSLVYRWILIVPPAHPEGAAVFSSILESFRSAKPAEVASLPPMKLTVLTAKPGDSIAGLAQRTAVAADGMKGTREQQFCILNALTLNDRIRPGQQLKIVE